MTDLLKAAYDSAALNHSALQFTQENRSRFLDELKDFIRIPSISTDPAAKADMQRAAEWVAGQLRSLGMRECGKSHPQPGTLWYTPSRWMQAPKNRPCWFTDITMYSQPNRSTYGTARPSNQPCGGKICMGRGTSDVKGQVVAASKRSRRWCAPPDCRINIKVMIEGEEEVGIAQPGSFYP